MDSAVELAEEHNPLQDAFYSDRVKPVLNAKNYRSFWSANNKYRDGASFLMLLINIQMIIIVVMSIMLYFYVSSEPDSDRYFVVNNDEKVSRLQWLNTPNTSMDSLGSWVASAVVEIMTFGFNDIEERFEISKKNFTEPGWKAFKDALITSGMIDNIINNKQMITVAPVSDPILIKDGFIQGKFKWVFQMEIMLTYRSGGEKKNDTRRVNVILEKMPTEDNPRGVGIAEWMLM